MKYLTPAIASFIFVLILSCNQTEDELAQEPVDKQVDPLKEQQYDSLKAVEYGADDYGMRQYVVAFLKAGPNRDRTPEEAMELQKAHMENIDRMAEEGKLVLAGPFLDEGELRGIYIFNVKTIEEARALTSTDPAIKASSLVMELKPWYGSAALVPLNNVHKNLVKKSITP